MNSDDAHGYAIGSPLPYLDFSTGLSSRASAGVLAFSPRRCLLIVSKIPRRSSASHHLASHRNRKFVHRTDRSDYQVGQIAHSELASTSRHEFAAAVVISVVNNAASMHPSVWIIIGEMNINT